MAAYDPKSNDAQFASIFAALESGRERASEFRTALARSIEAIKDVCENTLKQTIQVTGRVTQLEAEHRQNVDLIAKFLERMERHEEELEAQKLEVERHKSFAKGITWVVAATGAIITFFIQFYKK